MTRVLIAGMPSMLEDLLDEVIRTDDRLAVVGRLSGEGNLAQAVHVTQPDVVVIGGQHPGAASHFRSLLFAHPRVRLVLIDGLVQRGWHCALAFTVAALPEVSITSLLEAIHSTGRSDGAGDTA